MLLQALDRALLEYASIRRKIDETLSSETVGNIRVLWRPYRGEQNPYRKFSIAGVDSGFNYKEFRGYALYIQETVWIIIDREGQELCDGIVNVDVTSTTNIELELSLLSVVTEVAVALKLLDSVDLVVVDGSLLAAFSRIRKASLEEEHEVLVNKGVDILAVLKGLARALSKNPRKIAFMAKSSNSKDLLGLVKGDVYYFERYTDGVPGYSKPIDLRASKHAGVAAAARSFTNYVKNVTGEELYIVASYVRLEPYSRVYRLEFVVSPREDQEARARYAIDALSALTVAGYPYVLLRADQMARVSTGDINRVAAVLGIHKDPSSREPL